ncbi:hypothetical protein F4859DRAFT_26642 [Xylaria cf. heliscus]|nr:hypothetical protein F4859DRAFT_26642 [Xylaria cf. heliscus]
MRTDYGMGWRQCLPAATLVMCNRGVCSLPPPSLLSNCLACQHRGVLQIAATYGDIHTSILQILRNPCIGEAFSYIVHVCATSDAPYKHEAAKPPQSPTYLRNKRHGDHPGELSWLPNATTLSILCTSETSDVTTTTSKSCEDPHDGIVACLGIARSRKSQLVSQDRAYPSISAGYGSRISPKCKYDVTSNSSRNPPLGPHTMGNHTRAHSHPNDIEVAASGRLPGHRTMSSAYVLSNQSLLDRRLTYHGQATK